MRPRSAWLPRSPCAGTGNGKATTTERPYGTHERSSVRTHREELLSVAVHERLPELEARIRELEKRLAEVNEARA